MNLHYKILFVFLGILQVVDGLLTYMGIQTLENISLEGNPIVKALMEANGVILGLVLVKTAGCILVYLVYNMCNSVGKVSKPVLAGLYLIFLCYSFSSLVWIYEILLGQV